MEKEIETYTNLQARIEKLEDTVEKLKLIEGVSRVLELIEERTTA